MLGVLSVGLLPHLRNDQVSYLCHLVRVLDGTTDYLALVALLLQVREGLESVQLGIGGGGPGACAWTAVRFTSDPHCATNTPDATLSPGCAPHAAQDHQHQDGRAARAAQPGPVQSPDL